MDARFAAAGSPRGARTLAAVGFALALLCLSLPAPAAVQAKTRIVWSSIDPNGARQRLVTAQPNGSQRRELTDPIPAHTQDIDAQFSPDGTQVAFARELRNGKDAQIVLIGADGQNERVLDLGCVDPCALDYAPTWVDADRLAFTPVIGPFDLVNDSAHSAVLQTSTIDGSDPERLSEPGIDGVYEDYFARYSPDGSYIVFTRARNDTLSFAAFRMNVDGTDVRQLTPWGINADLADLSPATSGPTKNLVVFETVGGPPKNETTNLATVPATCASPSACKKQIRYLTNLKHGPKARFNPSWSPNGKRIAYTKFKGDRHECCVGDIFTMRADGSHRKPVSTSPKFEYRPDWGTAP